MASTFTTIHPATVDNITNLGVPHDIAQQVSRALQVAAGTDTKILFDACDMQFGGPSLVIVDDDETMTIAWGDVTGENTVRLDYRALRSIHVPIRDLCTHIVGFLLEGTDTFPANMQVDRGTADQWIQAWAARCGFDSAVADDWCSWKVSGVNGDGEMVSILFAAAWHEDSELLGWSRNTLTGILHDATTQAKVDGHARMPAPHPDGHHATTSEPDPVVCTIGSLTVDTLRAGVHGILDNQPGRLTITNDGALVFTSDTGRVETIGWGMAGRNRTIRTIRPVTRTKEETRP